MNELGTGGVSRMEIPANYEKLGRAGYVNRQNYSATATYNRMDTVYYQGSTYVALADNLTGVSPDDSGSSWMYLARGFSNVDEINSDIDELKSKANLPHAYYNSSQQWSSATKHTVNITITNRLYPYLFIVTHNGGNKAALFMCTKSVHPIFIGGSSGVSMVLAADPGMMDFILSIDEPITNWPYYTIHYIGPDRGIQFS